MNQDTFFLQLSYAKILGSRLERFKIKKEFPFLANSRCPVCLDSATNKTKTRFYIYEKEHQLNVMCHNCGLSTTLINFLKLHFKPLFDEFVFDKLKINGKQAPIITKKVEEFVPQKIAPRSVVLDLPYVADLPEDHEAVKYVVQRKLPVYNFQYAPRFFEFSKQYNDTLSGNTKDEPRLIIPFYDRSGNVFAYQGRSFNPKSAQKYITIIINPKIPKIFGIDRLDTKKEILLVEGPIDSLFLPNCLASVNASLTATANKLVTGININPNSVVVILDNEPRNESVVKQYDKAIRAGYRTVIWPKTIQQKDINAMVLDGINPLTVIKKNTFRGLEAELQFNSWKKV
jgi:hypothetical protein